MSIHADSAGLLGALDAPSTRPAPPLCYSAEVNGEVVARRRAEAAVELAVGAGEFVRQREQEGVAAEVEQLQAAVRVERVCDLLAAAVPDGVMREAELAQAPVHLEHPRDAARRLAAGEVAIEEQRGEPRRPVPQRVGEGRDALVAEAVVRHVEQLEAGAAAEQAAPHQRLRRPRLELVAREPQRDEGRRVPQREEQSARVARVVLREGSEKHQAGFRGEQGRARGG